MKKMMSLIGSALLAGVAMAAEVNGNNAAVVIKKDAINSGTNYQFLCAPVAGFDITGTNKAKKIPLEDIVSPASVKLYNTDEKPVTVLIDDDSYTLSTSGDAWIPGGCVLDPGQTFWLKNVPTTVTFCGQNSELGIAGTVVAGGLSTLGNASSNTINISDLVPKTDTNNGVLPADITLRSNAILFVLKEGQTNYGQYFYNGTKWRKEKTSPVSGGVTRLTDVEDDVDTIKPGEAFYLQ